MKNCFLWMCLAAAIISVYCGRASELRLDAERGITTNVPVRLSSTVSENTLLTLESSTNLAEWEGAGVFHDGLLSYPVFGPTGQRYFRVLSRPRSAADDWKNQITYDDPFRNWGWQEQVDWVKFAIVLEEPTRVYYQKSSVYPFHYDFAVARLPGFKGMDRATFDSVSLYRTNQQVVLGAVLLPASGVMSEYGVQFVGLEPYSPQEIGRWFEAVRETVYSLNRARPFYVPTYEQSEVARTNQAAFEALGVGVASIDRWISANHVYSPGWAVGQLKFFAAAEIAAAFADGRLRPADILLTDGVPAETPPVAAIISLRASTPNSHTAILSRSFGIPFVYFPEAQDQARVQTLAGRKILIRANLTHFGSAEAAVFDVEETLTAEAEAELKKLKVPGHLEYAEKTPYGAYVAATDGLTPADVKHFGGKASNYGFLRRTIGTRSLPAIAFSFDLWDAYLGQQAPGTGRTLREEIALRLAPFKNYPPDVTQLKPVLQAVRDLVRSGNFTADQEQTITNSLQVFDGTRKIRFRSSTNVEDAEQFTGAGLYDSYSGCLMDDQDTDVAGPSWCEAGEPQERGVFRAIRRVYASFYNDHAFMERLRYGVDEATVGMAVLAHHSFPDEDELANGVATLTYRSSGSVEQITGEMVTQKGSESVTNPDGASLPEVVGWERFNGRTYFTLTRYSSLMPLGAKVLEWEMDYNSFADLFLSVMQGFRGYYPNKARFTLDFEYKKDRDRGLIVKQVREVPDPNPTGETLAFLLDTPTRLTVAQKEAADVFSNHYLKSVWELRTRSMWLAESNIATGLYDAGRMEYVEDGARLELTGPLASWPDAEVSANGRTNTWATGSGPGGKDWLLWSDVVATAPPGTAAVYTQGDYAKFLFVKFAEAQPTIDYNGPGLTKDAVVLLEPERTVDSGSILVQRSFATNGITIETKFYWPRPPGGMDAGYTAPLVRFVETRISGMTPAPMVLTNYYAQTYRPGHHNFSEEFIFEPRLDPGLSAETKAALAARNVRLLYLRLGGPDLGRVLGFDQKFRDL